MNDPVQVAERERKRELHVERQKARRVLDHDERQDLQDQITYWQECYRATFRMLSGVLKARGVEDITAADLALVDEVIQIRWGSWYDDERRARVKRAENW